uniref:Uncharacterized protein n=1 Tax=Triticum urartu TaxID=4572 RepID=A0A8R7VC32_TRIUA
PSPPRRSPLPAAAPPGFSQAGAACLAPKPGRNLQPDPLKRTDAGRSAAVLVVSSAGTTRSVPKLQSSTDLSRLILLADAERPTNRPQPSRGPRRLLCRRNSQADQAPLFTGTVNLTV